MKELSPREEQAMIERAKAGDPEANYQMSLWALEHAEAEPEEERWNRLAAKCLVKAAQAGYAPAIEQMNGLLHQQPAPERRAPEPRRSPPPQRPRSEQAPRRLHVEEPPPEPERLSPLERVKALPGKISALFSRRAKAQAADMPREKMPLFSRFDQWDDAKWKRIQWICIAICVVLAVAIALMLVTGRKKAPEPQEPSQLPTAPTTEPAAPSPTPEPPLYPDETVRSRIQAAGLVVFPADEEYVSVKTTASVRTSGNELRMRKGPDASYELISSMANGTTVEVYAEKSGWALVLHDNTFGWCSKEYLEIGG